MAIFNLTAEFTTNDGRLWRAFWKRKALSHNDAIRRAESDLENAGAIYRRIKSSLSDIPGVSVIGNSGRIMMVERGRDGKRGDAAQVVHFVNGHVRSIGELSPTESDYIWARTWDL